MVDKTKVARRVLEVTCKGAPENVKSALHETIQLRMAVKHFGSVFVEKSAMRLAGKLNELDEKETELYSAILPILDSCFE